MRKGFSKSLIVIGIVLLVWSIITMATDWVSPLFLPSLGYCSSLLGYERKSWPSHIYELNDNS